MATAVNGIGRYLSGTIEGLVFVNGRFKTYMRSLPRKRQAEEWTNKQRQQRKGFGALIKFAGEQKLEVIVPIWNKAARDINMSGFNLFTKANRAAFDDQGTVKNPALLHFSTGPLSLPYRLWAKADAQNPGRINITWSNQLQGTANANDCLLALIYQNEASKIINTGFTRKDGKAIIDHPSFGEGDVFLFLFFWDETNDTYSPDQVFSISQSNVL